MKMIYDKFWTCVTIILSLVFVMMFYPVAVENSSWMNALLLTLLGLAIIWIVFYVRAYIFRDFEDY